MYFWIQLYSCYEILKKDHNPDKDNNYWNKQLFRPLPVLVFYSKGEFDNPVSK